jgi:hypothetical protein
MFHQYILDSEKTPVVCEDALAWAKWMGQTDRRVAFDTFGTGEELVEVSTVFLGVNYNHFGGQPVLFETMVFTKCDLEVMDRYRTWAEAEAGHRILLATIQALVAQSRTITLNLIKHTLSLVEH